MPHQGRIGIQIHQKKAQSHISTPKLARDRDNKYVACFIKMINYFQIYNI